MKLTLLLLIPFGLALAQPPIYIPLGAPVRALQVDTNFTNLYNQKIGRWTGSGAPGNFPFSVIGDVYFDLASTGTIYGCYHVPCTAVAAGNWVQISGGGGGGGGSVTSVGL